MLDPFLTCRDHVAPYRKRYNPLAMLRIDSDTVIEDAGMIADALVVPSAGKDPHWDESARNFIEGLILHIASDASFEGRRTLVTLRQDQLDGRRVRARMHGVLQAVPVEVGSQVTAGTNVARVANPSDLKAQVRVPETQARDVQIGQVARVDTRNGIVTGQVTRVDPAAVSGTVLVDITLTGDLPRGARPDLSVDGIIEIERLADTLYVGRPAAGQEQGTISLFRIGPDGLARRVPVTLGKGSVRAIEVVDGLGEGDRVILSDMSAWDQVDELRCQGETCLPPGQR